MVHVGMRFVFNSCFERVLDSSCIVLKHHEKNVLALQTQKN